MNHTVTFDREGAETLGRNLANGAGRAIGHFLMFPIAFCIAIAILAAIFDWPKRDSTDSPTERSNLRPRVDYGTGCQYLESRNGFLTPRLDRNGKQMCGSILK